LCGPLRFSSAPFVHISRVFSSLTPLH
jgi:hypothetical protein